MEHEGENAATLAKWSELDPKEGGQKFFSPKPDKPYKIRFSDVKLERKQFQQKGDKKLTAVCILASVDGESATQVFETKSFTIMKELRKHVKDEIWKGAAVTFFLKKKVDGDKTTYVFEDMSEPTP